MLCTRAMIVSVNADTAPVRMNRAIRLPMKPQTRITQPTVSFCMTESEISAARLSGSVGAIMKRPTMVPASSDSMVRCDHTARTITTRVGIRARAPYSVTFFSLCQLPVAAGMSEPLWMFIIARQSNTMATR